MDEELSLLLEGNCAFILWSAWPPAANGRSKEARMPGSERATRAGRIFSAALQRAYRSESCGPEDAGVKSWAPLLCVALTRAVAAEPQLCDLVVGRLERHGDSLVIAYQNQGRAAAPATPLALRIASNRSELMTVYDQPPAIQPLEIRRSAPIPFRLLGLDSKAGSHLEVRIDPMDQIHESNEVNNEYSHNFQPAGKSTLYPRWERYLGYPDLAIERLDFVAPDAVEATVVNRGVGVTMGTYHGRFKVNGLAQELQYSGGRAQPLPRPGQSDKWLFHIGEFQLKAGQTARVEFQIDPEQRIPDSDRSNNKRNETMLLGGPLPDSVAPNKVSGDLNERGRSWRAAGCFANLIQPDSSVHLSIFPFQLKTFDLPGLIMNDPMSVLEARVPGYIFHPDGSREPKSAYDNTPFAQLILTFPMGASEASTHNLVEASWRSGTCNYSAAGSLEKDALAFKPFALQAGALVDFALHRQVRGQARLHLFPKVIRETPFGDPLPDDVPPNQASGIVSYGREVFRPRSVCAFFRAAEHRLDLLLWDNPIEPREVQGLLRGRWNLHRYNSRNKLVELQLYFDSKNLNRSPQMCLVVGKSGLNASFRPLHKANALCQLRAPRLGHGLPLTFRLRGRCSVPGGQADVDVAGLATILEVR
ncbi:MAG: CARDB domain-containing protein [Vulcanimicrobiota bacterium]